MTPAPCPYCRPGEPMLCSAPLPTKEPRTGYWVGCQKCLARGPQALSERKAVARWNEVARKMLTPDEVKVLRFLSLAYIRLGIVGNDNELVKVADEALARLMPQKELCRKGGGR